MNCSPFYQNSALHPMIDLIEQTIGRAGSVAMADRSTILRQALSNAGLADEMTFALMASLVGLATEDDASLADLAPDQRRRRTLDTLIAWLHAESQSGLLILIVEDLHWIDPSTRDLIGTLLERITEMPIMVLLTYRPEFVPMWAMHGQISTLPLARLTSEQCAAVAIGLAGGDLLPTEIVDEVIRRTDGVPLYVEELTKSIIEAQASSAGAKGSVSLAGLALQLEVPATLRDSLTARLDRLGAAKMVAQLASVLGREFDYGILLAICDLPQAGLEQQLAALNHAEIIRQSGIPPRSHYAFKHALIQEAAYDTLLKTARTQYHRRAAEAYVKNFPDIAESRPELVAHHFSRASLPALAVPLWHRAGEIAVLRSGYSEAIGHLSTALQQLALLPESNDRLATELAIRVKLGTALISKGLGAPEYSRNYEIATRIAEALGDSAEGFMALWGDWLAKGSTGRILDAARRSDDLVALSQRLGNDEYVLQAHHSRWTNFYVMGDSTISRSDTLVGIRLYDRELHRHHRHLYGGHDPGVCACGTGANAAWLTGHADEALRLADQAIEIGVEIEHPFSQSIAAMWATLATVGVRNHALARDHAEALLHINERAGVPTWSGLAMIVLGAFRVSSGETEYGVKLIEEGLASQRQYGSAGWLGTLLAICAPAYMQSGNLGRASELLDEAIAHAEKTNARVLLPENQRLHTEVLLLTKRIDPSEAVGRLRQAVALAHQQGALALAWRATTSLARLHAAQGRDDLARRVLSEQFGGPFEGFASPDLADGTRLRQQMR